MTTTEPTILSPQRAHDVTPGAAWGTRVLFAIASLGAAAIHFAMVPSHAAEWLTQGIAFAVVGWIQIALAAAVVARPRKSLLVLAVALNVAFIAAWTWTRVWGPPFGPLAGDVHPIAFVDLTCVVLEVAAAVLAAVALRGGPTPVRRPAVTAGLAAGLVAVVALVCAAIVSPGATSDDHGGSSDHAQTPANSDEGDPHGHGAAMSADSAHVDDKGLSALSNGEMAHEYGPDQPLDARTRAALVHQLSLTRLLVDTYPTLKDAKAAGAQPAGGFGPGMGIHMSTPRTGLPTAPPRDPAVPYIAGTLTDEQLLRPANILYDGTADDSKIVGFMYYALTADEPAGFAGLNDHWHTHGSLCLKMGGAGGKIEVLHPAEPSGPACQEIGGFWVEKTNWMVHVWTVPGYESSRGVFSDINPAIACPDGTYYRVAGADDDRYKLNKCRSNPE